MTFPGNVSGKSLTPPFRAHGWQCGGFGVAGLADQMRGNGPIDDTQYLAHDGGVGLWNCDLAE